MGECRREARLSCKDYENCNGTSHRNIKFPSVRRSLWDRTPLASAIPLTSKVHHTSYLRVFAEPIAHSLQVSVLHHDEAISIGVCRRNVFQQSNCTRPMSGRRFKPPGPSAGTSPALQRGATLQSSFLAQVPSCLIAAVAAVQEPIGRIFVQTKVDYWIFRPWYHQGGSCTGISWSFRGIWRRPCRRPGAKCCMRQQMPIITGTPDMMRLQHKPPLVH